MDWLDDLIARFIGDADDLVTAQGLPLTVRTGGDGAAAAYLDVCRQLGESADDSAGLIAALAEYAEPSIIEQIGMLVAACFASVKADYAARPDAQAARVALSLQADAVIDAAGALYGADVHRWLIRLVGEAVVQISAIAANRAPLVRVETGLSLPSSLLAYDLYGDPARGAELIERNRTGTPMVMPVTFEALAI